MNSRTKEIIRERYRSSRESIIEELVEVDDSDDAVETHEKDWLRKNKWKQPWNKKRRK